MSVVFILISNSGSTDSNTTYFHKIIETAQKIKNLSPVFRVESSRIKIFSLPNRVDSISQAYYEESTGEWLIAIGTWFHGSGISCGKEAALLKIIKKADIFHVANELEGSYVLIYGNKNSHSCIIVTDIIGSAHVYIRKIKNGIAISNSSLLLALLEKYTLDLTGCQEFIYTGTIYQDRTFYEEIKKLGPAKIFQIDHQGIISEKQYWHMNQLDPVKYNGTEAVEKIWNLLNCTVQKINNYFNYPVCDLTGGYDSRAIFSAYLNDGRPFSTTVTGKKDSADVKISSGLANLHRIEHTTLEIPDKIKFEDIDNSLKLTDGEYDLVEYSGILSIHNRLSKKYGISVNGSFGEIARGYWWELLFPNAGKCIPIDPSKLAIYRYAYHSHDSSLFPPETRLNIRTHFTHIIEDVTHGLTNLPNTMQMDHAYLNMRMQRWQGRIGSSTSQIWHCISPFMFKQILEMMLQINPQLRRRGLVIRKMLNKYQPQLASYPLEHGYPAEPVTVKNFYRFYPLLEHYSMKAKSKLKSYVGISDTNKGTLPIFKSKRVQLWEREDIKEILNGSSMQLVSIMDKESLFNFLNDSKKDVFTYESQWNRILSLEFALRKSNEFMINSK